MPTMQATPANPIASPARRLAVKRLGLPEGGGEQHHEQWDGRVQQARQRRGDPQLADRDERHGNGDLDRRDDQQAAPVAAQVREHARPGSHRQHDGQAAHQPEPGREDRREVVQRDLDEEVAGAPHRRQQDDSERWGRALHEVAR
jgi:hypothetical protein